MMGKSFELAKFIKMKAEMERIAKIIEDLKKLPNCYSCKGRLEGCPHCLVDDSMPSRYNCPQYERDDSLDIVENC